MKQQATVVAMRSLLGLGLGSVPRATARTLTLPMCSMFTGTQPHRQSSTSDNSTNEGERKPLDESVVRDFCVNLVRNTNREKYVALTLLPKRAALGALAVHAFNSEVALINSHAYEEAAVQMRYLFWKDALNAIIKSNGSGSDIPQHPVAKLLAHSMQEFRFTGTFLRQLLSARESTASDVPFQTYKSAEAYAERTCSNLYYLTLEALGVRSAAADHVASHLGQAEGLVTLLRGVPHLASKGKLRLPLDVCADAGVVQNDVIKGRDTEELREAIFRIATAAVMHLNTGKSLMDSCPEAARVAFLPSIAHSRYLTALEHHEFNIFSPTLQRPDGLLPMRLLVAKLRKNYP